MHGWARRRSWVFGLIWSLAHCCLGLSTRSAMHTRGKQASGAWRQSWWLPNPIQSLMIGAQQPRDCTGSNVQLVQPERLGPQYPAEKCPIISLVTWSHVFFPTRYITSLYAVVHPRILQADLVPQALTRLSPRSYAVVFFPIKRILRRIELTSYAPSANCSALKQYVPHLWLLQYRVYSLEHWHQTFVLSMTSSSNQSTLFPLQAWASPVCWLSAVGAIASDVGMAECCDAFLCTSFSLCIRLLSAQDLDLTVPMSSWH